MTTRGDALRTRAGRGLVIAALTGVAAAVSVAGAAPASAHDALIGVDPADGSTQAAVPAEVTLRFEEPPLALGIAVAVLGPTGEVNVGAPSLAGSAVSVALRPGSPPGNYRVSWRVTSDDGHPVQGTTRFTARARSAVTNVPSGTATLQATTPTAGAASSATSPATSTGSTAPVAADPSVAPAPVASTGGASGQGVVVVVVLGLVVGAVVAVVVGRRRAG